ncbi:sodium:proton antiporter NhaD [uncultured Alistipes sp.]|uniref:sodium:proton antiporter NhaD n=1 Tax=uncultured Alistipes sp. TaxID=538949 RepID=UPI00260BBCBF|nr:sodium:proton antiporter NhaD [uncultured Alistipes sp.]
MITAMIAIFALGYLCIALEHRLKIDKAATALVMCGVLWTLFALRGGDGGLGDALAGHLGSTCEILVFLIGAMAIVGLIDACGGFAVVTRRIAVRGKRRLLWLLALVAFFMSAVLDNMTTAIVMVTLLRALVPDRDERWLCASVIVIAANSGGAWSPIGDVTTIMLWMNDNVTAWPLMRSLLLPCLVSTVIPVLLASRGLRGTFPAPAAAAAAHVGKRIAAADAPTRRSARTSAAGNGRNPGRGKADAAARAEAAARRRSLLFLAAGVAGCSSCRCSAALPACRPTWA